MVGTYTKQSARMALIVEKYSDCGDRQHMATLTSIKSKV